MFTTVCGSLWGHIGTDPVYAGQEHSGPRSEELLVMQLEASEWIDGY